MTKFMEYNIIYWAYAIATALMRISRGYKDKKSFDDGLGECGRDLLARSLKRYCDSMDQLEPYFTKIAGRTN